MGYIHLFDTTSEFDARRGDGYEEPWASYTDQTEAVDYNLTYDEKRIQRPLTFQILSGGNIYWTASKAGCERTIEWRKYTFNWDTLVGTWTDWTEITSSTGGTAIAVNAEDIVEFRGNNTNYYVSGSTTGGTSFNPKGTKAVYNVYGNIMSLCHKTGFSAQTSLTGECVFYSLFQGNDVIDATYLGLPAMTLTTFCYSDLFRGCGKLTAAPELPADNLAPNCYRNMFQGCSSLTTAPELPASGTAQECYRAMFQQCSGLVTGPKRVGTSATTMAEGCCYDMFQDCSSLVTAPELPAPTLSTNSYRQMFQRCSSLNYIKCLATNTGASNSTNAWTQNVNASGTFIKARGMSSWTTGANGIPTGWAVEEYDASLLSLSTGLLSDIPDTGGVFTVTVESTASWTATCDSWISLSDGAGGSGVTDVTVTVGEAGQPRTGSIIFRCGDKSAVVLVIQS